MKVLIVLLLAVYIASAAVLDLSLKRQLCEDRCTPGAQETGCHWPQICVSNGCGHSCHYILPKKRAQCLGAICNLYCENGNKLSADGCLMCACNPGPVDIL